MIHTTKRILLILCVLLLVTGIMCFESHALSTAIAQIPIEIHCDGDLPTEKESFVIELVPDKSDYPMPDESENGVYQISVNSNDSAVIEIPCDRVGVYTYTVKQLPGDNDVCIYDESVYGITVFVTYAEDGSLEVNIAVYDSNSQKESAVEFSNYYSFPAVVSISAIKTLDGGTPGDKAFSFELIDSTGKTVETVQNIARDVTFQPLQFSESGTFQYTVKEVKGNKNNISYDTSVYEAIIAVELDEHNDYKATLTYTKDGKAHTGTPIFSNVTRSTGLPQTGDTQNIYLYIGLMVVSALAILMVLTLRKKARKSY